MSISAYPAPAAARFVSAFVPSIEPRRRFRVGCGNGGVREVDSSTDAGLRGRRPRCRSDCRECRGGCQAGHRLAAVPRHSRQRDRRGLSPADLVGHREERSRRLEDADRRPRPVQPHRLGRSRLPVDGDQRREVRRPEGRALRRRQAGDRRHRARMAGVVPRQEDRRREMAAVGAEGGAEDQAAHEVHPRQLDARDRRRSG